MPIRVAGRNVLALFSIGVVSILLMGLVTPAPELTRLPRGVPALPAKPGELSFLVFGDSGTGRPGQLHLAAAMARVIRSSPVDFALLLGDNFYPNGLASVNDPLFDRVFRDPYPPATFPFPFFPVLGNHEYLKNAGVLPRLGTRDPRWRMPARRYAFLEPLSANETVLFVALDTTAIDSPPRVTPDVDVQPPLQGVAEELAAAANARWRFAFGHHPLRSSGVHRSSEGMLRDAAPILAAGRVDLYFCGHDHILESLGPVQGVSQIISGGGGGWDRATPIVGVQPESLFRLTGGGFVRAVVRSDEARFTFFDVDGILRHVRTLTPRLPPPAAASAPASPALN